MPYRYSWDRSKSAYNIRYHGIDFAAVERFDWETATIEVDDREDYGELREFALGFIGDVLHGLVFTRENDDVRVISLRKANKNERRTYARRRV